MQVAGYTQEQLEQMRKDHVEHLAVLDMIKVVLGTPAGRAFAKYLLKSFEVGELPPIGVENDYLRDKLGFLRAGVSVFEILAQANPDVTGTLLAQIQKEKYEIIQYDQARERK